MRGRLTLLLAVLLAAPASAAADEADVPGAFAAFAAGAASAAGAVGDLASGAAGAAGDGLAAAAGGTASLARALGDLLVGAARALAGGLAALVSGAAGAVVALLALVADLAGAVVALVRDDARRAVHVAGGAVGAAGAGMLAHWLRRVGLGALLAPFVPLYSRLSSEDVLRNGARSSVYDHIVANPGAHPRQIALALGLGWGTVVYHLRRLEERGLVAATKKGAMKCYFAAGSTPAPERARFAALKHPTAQAIADYVRANPNARQKDVALSLGLSQALVSWHVTKLEAAGVLSRARAGKATELVAAPLAPRASA